LNRLATEFANL